MRLLVATVFPLGLLAAVNPCGFPLLPAYLGRFSAAGRADAGPWSERGPPCSTPPR
jgi:cytochrome c biogenesis protein CcdA